MVDVDAQWLQLRGRWDYWFVVLDVPTALPVLAALLPARGPWAWRWVGRQLRQRTHVPTVRITAGFQASASLVPGAQHVLCRLHHQPGVTHGLPQHCATEAEGNARQPAMKRLFHTPAQRTVRRRRARLRAQAPELGMTPGVTTVEANLPKRICSLGSARLPATPPAMERCFRAFARFDKTRTGLHAVRSATRALLLLLVVQVFTPHATTGQAPIAVIVPEARRLPLYRWINDPFRALQERGNVKGTPHMADVLRPEEATA